MSNLGFENTDTFLLETRVFPPSPDTVEHANITAYMKSKGFDDYNEFYKWSLENRFRVLGRHGKRTTLVRAMAKDF